MSRKEKLEGRICDILADLSKDIPKLQGYDILDGSTIDASRLREQATERFPARLLSAYREQYAVLKELEMLMKEDGPHPTIEDIRNLADRDSTGHTKKPLLAMKAVYHYAGIPILAEVLVKSDYFMEQLEGESEVSTAVSRDPRELAADLLTMLIYYLHRAGEGIQITTPAFTPSQLVSALLDLLSLDLPPDSGVPRAVGGVLAAICAQAGMGFEMETSRRDMREEIKIKEGPELILSSASTASLCAQRLFELERKAKKTYINLIRSQNKEIDVVARELLGNKNITPASGNHALLFAMGQGAQNDLSAAAMEKNVLGQVLRQQNKSLLWALILTIEGDEGGTSDLLRDEAVESLSKLLFCWVDGRDRSNRALSLVPNHHTDKRAAAISSGLSAGRTLGKPARDRLDKNLAHCIEESLLDGVGAQAALRLVKLLCEVPTDVPAATRVSRQSSQSSNGTSHPDPDELNRIQAVQSGHSGRESALSTPSTTLSFRGQVQDQFLELDMLQYLIKILCLETEAVVLKEAVGAISAMIPGKQHIAKRVLELDGVSVCIQILRKDPESLGPAVSHLLQRLCSEDVDCCSVLVQQHGVKLLVNLLASGTKSAQEWAAWTLLTIGEVSADCRAAATREGLPALLKVFHDSPFQDAPEDLQRAHAIKMLFWATQLERMMNETPKQGPDTSFPSTGFTEAETKLIICIQAHFRGFLSRKRVRTLIFLTKEARQTFLRLEEAINDPNLVQEQMTQGQLVTFLKKLGVFADATQMIGRISKTHVSTAFRAVTKGDIVYGALVYRPGAEFLEAGQMKRFLRRIMGLLVREHTMDPDDVRVSGFSFLLWGGLRVTE